MPNSSAPATLSQARPIFIAEIEQFGGAERSLLALSGWLHRRNLPHYLLTYADHCNVAGHATHPLPVLELRPGASVRAKIAALKQHFQQRGPSPWQPLLSGYQPALHATLAGLRGFHDLMHDTPALFGDRNSRSLKDRLRIAVSNRIAAWGLRSGGTTIVTSEYLRSECSKDFGIHAEIARMGGLGGTSPLKLRPVTSELRMLSVCRIEANKRIDWLLRALGTLEAEPTPLSATIDWRLDLAGKGTLIPQLEQLAASLGITNRVHFHGFVPDEAVEAMYDQAHLFLMPAIQGYGIPAIESLGRGIPVLLHRESGVSDILLDTPWATVLTGGEPNLLPALRQAIAKLLENRHHAVSPPHLPTEDEWAERVATLCNWVP
jgi:glycosyltransferase involved in cell wall biosynthesis